MAKEKFKLNIFIGLAILILLFFPFKVGMAANQGTSPVDLKIYFSGILRDGQGDTAVSDKYNMRFNIYPEAVGSSSLWQEEFIGQKRVSVIDGRFQVILGTGNSINFNIENQKYWLGVTVGGNGESISWDDEMDPRIPIVTLQNLFLEGRVDVSHEDFIRVLVEEFKSQATSSEPLSQRAFLSFLQERLNGAEAQAIIISPQTLNILFEEIINFEDEAGDTNGYWQLLLQFFQDILDSISQSLNQIFEKISEILLRLTNIEQKQNEIISILRDDENQEEIDDVFPEKETGEVESSLGPNFLVEDFGEAGIAAGETSVKIFTEYLTPNSKIFITINSAISGVWWISDRRIGEYFEISILSPPEEDLGLDYWIVTPKEEILTVPSLEEEPEEDHEETDMRKLIKQRQDELRGNPVDQNEEDQSSEDLSQETEQAEEDTSEETEENEEIEGVEELNINSNPTSTNLE